MRSQDALAKSPSAVLAPGTDLGVDPGVDPGVNPGADPAQEGTLFDLHANVLFPSQFCDAGTILTLFLRVIVERSAGQSVARTGLRLLCLTPRKNTQTSASWNNKTFPHRSKRLLAILTNADYAFQELLFF